MTRSTFEAMSLDDLWNLHKRVESILKERLDRERQKLENQLRELTLKFGGTRERRQYPKVAQKFRNPAYQEQTWSGRGKQPHWVKTWIASGANLDDLGDVRPGLRAAEERGVRHPLVEVGMWKSDVRAAARELGVPTWDKPASACLSSRIAFGVMISVEELSKVGRAERVLKELGFAQCRVRVHGDVARVEVELAELPRFAEPGVRDQVVRALRSLGYRYVTLDLEGFRSGSMNPELPA